MISGMVGQQIGTFQGYSGYAQGIGVGAGLYPPQQGQVGGMMPPSGMMGVRPGQAGMYGEQVAMRMANTGMSMGAGVGAGMRGGASMFMPFDPMSGALMGGMAGMAGGPMGALVGAAGGAAVGAGLGMASYATQRTIGAYTNAFTGGMQDQASLNSTLRNNFQFFGGQGAMGRGFGQSQMGQIGSMISGELRRNPMSNSQEMNNLVAGGADSGQFTGTRDVQQFTQNFRRMLDNLKSVQRELGGTLTDALSFVRSSQQAGIYQNADRVNFAAEIRTAEAVTGMDRNQLVALSAQGAGIARTFGARGAQGAHGVLRAATTMGAALSSGSVSQELLSEATGGATGPEAIAQFSASMMQRAGNFSRRGMGRISMFAMSNATGDGLDDDMLARFRSGDISTGDVSRRAHSNVRGMGRAHALNREGRLRGEMMEEGGMSAQIGMMRMMLGDRALDAGDDTAQLVMQRRFHMSQPESELMIGMIRNQGRIAETEAVDRRGAAHATARSRDITENRSFEAFERELEHGLSDATGLTAARDMGRRAMTRVSSFVERAMNDVMGVAETSLSQGDRGALNRVAMGRATAADIARLDTSGVAHGQGLRTADLFQQSLATRGINGTVSGAGALGTIGTALGGAMGGALGNAIGHRVEEGFHHTPDAMRMSLGDRLEARGVTGLRGENGITNALTAIQELEMARVGTVTGSTRREVLGMEMSHAKTARTITEAELEAGGRGTAEFYRALTRRGVSSNAADAFMAREGVTDFGGEYNASNIGGGSATDPGMWLRDTARGVGALGRMLSGGPAGIVSGGMDLLAMGGAFGAGGEAETMRALASPAERSGQDVRAIITEQSRRIEHRAESARGEEAAGLRATAEHMRGVSEDALTALADNEGFQNIARRISQSGTLEETSAAISELDEMALRGTDEERMAIASTAAALREDITSGGGALSESSRQRLGTLAMSPRRARAIENERQLRAGVVSATSRRVAEGLGGEGATASGLALTGADRDQAKQMSGLMEARATAMTTGDSAAASRASRSLFEGMARLDPNSAAYRYLSESMGTGDDADLDRMRITQLRQFTRDVSGQGRQRQRGADRTALEGLTGNTMGEMEFHLGGGTTGRRERTVRGSNTSAIMQMLTSSGGESGEVQSQLVEHLRQLGVTGSEVKGESISTADMVSQFANLAQGGISNERGPGGGPSEAERVAALFEGSGITEKVAAREAAETRATATRSDPLGVDRNALLTQMLGHLGTIAGASGGEASPAPPTGIVGAVRSATGM